MNRDQKNHIFASEQLMAYHSKVQYYHTCKYMLTCVWWSRW